MTQVIQKKKKMDFETIKELESYIEQLNTDIVIEVNKKEDGEAPTTNHAPLPPEDQGEDRPRPQVQELTSGNKKELLIPLEYIQLSMHQFREEIDWEHVKSLAEDIAENGLEYPIVVYQLGENNYVVKDGEHRFHAVKSLGWKRIPATLVLVDDGMKADLDAARLNLLRKEYDRKALYHVIQTLLAKGYSQNWIARKFHLRKSKVNLFAKLSRSESDRLEPLKKAFLEGFITEAHVTQLMKVLDYPGFFHDKLDEVIEDQITAKQLEYDVKRFLEDMIPEPEEHTPSQESQSQSQNDSWESIWSHDSQKKADQQLEKTHEIGGGVKNQVNCARCGRPLTAPESRKLGIGPVCALMAKQGDLGMINEQDTKTLEKVSKAYEYYSDLGYYQSEVESIEKETETTRETPSENHEHEEQDEKELHFHVTKTEATTLIFLLRDQAHTSLATKLEEQFDEQGGVF